MRKTASPEQFIRVWQHASTIQEAAKKLGTSAKLARLRANLFIKNGVGLKKLKRNGRYDWDALRKLAKDELRG